MATKKVTKSKAKPSRSPVRKAAPAKKRAAKVAKPAEKPKKLGRPSTFTKAIGDKICQRIAEGESLRAVCLTESMPDKSTVFRWLETDLTFRDQYVRAREVQADSDADDVVDIADDAGTDIETVEVNGKKEQRINGEAVNRARLRIDARKWRAAKMHPKKYGDRITHQGDDEAPPIQVESTELTMAQRAARLSSLMHLAAREKKAGAPQ